MNYILALTIFVVAICCTGYTMYEYQRFEDIKFACKVDHAECQKFIVDHCGGADMLGRSGLQFECSVCDDVVEVSSADNCATKRWCATFFPVLAATQLYAYVATHQMALLFASLAGALALAFMLAIARAVNGNATSGKVIYIATPPMEPKQQPQLEFHSARRRRKGSRRSVTYASLADGRIEEIDD